MKKKKQKGNSNDLRTKVIRQTEPRYPQHIHSLLSRFSLQPPFIEVLSGLLRAAYWPLVFSFSSFSGLFWPGPFFPIFRQWIPKRCKLPMSFPWPVFPGLDQDLFPLMVFLVFWDTIPKRCKGVHCVDLGESFPTSIYLQNLASIQPRTSLLKFEGGRVLSARHCGDA